MNIFELRQNISREIIDYNLLMSALSSYAHARGKISEWLHKGELIRVKKGLYVFGPQASRNPYSIENLANLIYGPSAISLHYALNFYGLIPERVHSVTSITNKRNKQFTTPVGEFTYQYLHPKKYAIGIDIMTSSPNSSYFIATPEKALCDLIALTTKNISLESTHEFENFVFEDLRLDNIEFGKLNRERFQEIARVYANQRLNKFTNLLLKWKFKNA